MADSLADMVMPKFEAPSNYKDADKIAAHIACQQASWRDKLALDALTGRVCAIGSLPNDDKGQVQMGFSKDTSEKDLIESFWDYFQSHTPVYRFVGFNIKRFDLTFLVRRSMALGVSIPLGVRDGFYWGDSWVDLLEIYQCGDRKDYISLDTLAKFLGVGEKSGNGKDFHKLPPDEQRKYLAHDLELTKLCAEKMIL